MVLLGAVIVAGSLVWYGTRSVASGFNPGQTPPVPDTSRPKDIPDPAVTYSKKMPDFLAQVISVGEDHLVVQRDGAAVTIMVTSKTTIQKQGTKKDAAAYAKEMEAFTKSISYGSPDDQYYAPSPYELIKISLSAIAKDDLVYVKTNGSIDTDSITATSIEVLAQPGR